MQGGVFESDTCNLQVGNVIVNRHWLSGMKIWVDQIAVASYAWNCSPQLGLHTYLAMHQHNRFSMQRLSRTTLPDSYAQDNKGSGYATPGIHLWLASLTFDSDKGKYDVEKIRMVAETAIKVFSNSWPVNADTNFLSLFNIVNWIKEETFVSFTRMQDLLYQSLNYFFSIDSTSRWYVQRSYMVPSHWKNDKIYVERLWQRNQKDYKWCESVLII